MTKSAKPRTQPPPPPPPRRLPGLLFVGTMVFNLLLLGVGSVLAWFLGMAIAQVYPKPSAEVPLTEQLLRQQQNRGSEGIIPQPVVSPSSPSPKPIPAPSQKLTDPQRQQLQVQLQQLQGQLNTLMGKTAALETQFGSSRPTEPLEERLQILEQQLAAATPTSAAGGKKPTQPSPPPISATPERRQNSNTLVVTFPSDVLFDVGSTILRPGANVILDTIITDIKTYKGSAVRIVGHTDNQGNPQQNLDLSFSRAEAVMKYLSEAAGTGYHWVAIGYGENRPTVNNNSENNRQLNRRIEVAITP
ncbi:putative Outer membrane protein F [Planktothrix serta PCC 8927]|uniref:Outer membrane protein F n=1 Tax=Planktothrix serta PCC 8927 TaxID=671068 RepID=A0A7Z9DYN7_9CYAN|nr:OmpA family protein [Planktothrix serta]VXD18413.1 putative Outer membrane protein F [Planktothrix serta PCC 8927]